jgi:uncharacterized protein (TIGR04222 family)
MQRAMARPAHLRHRAHRVVRLSPLVAAILLAVAPAALAAGPPYPDPVDGQAVYDTANLFQPETRTQAEGIIDAIEAQTKAEVVVYTQALGRDDITTEDAEADAKALMDQWGVGRAGLNDGLVILFDLDTSLQHGQVQLFAGPGFSESYLSDEERQAIYEGTMLPLLQEQQFDEALLGALGQVVTATFDGTPPGTPEEPPAQVITPGPPYPDPEVDRAVYDFAGILSPEAIVKAESTIDAIEARTAAEVVVYTELADYGVSQEETEGRAIALIDQWGVGRKGFDDGLAIFFDIDPSLQHGQVELYAARGFEAAYLSNSERQKVYDEDMLPFLREADFDGALNAALTKVDAAATPEHAAQLQWARQINSAVGLIGAPIAFLALAGWALSSWRRFGKDPVYLDDPSILMPAPPPELTAASGAFVMEGGPSRRALTTAMLDLASRGLLAFREDRGFLDMSNKVGIVTEPKPGDEAEEAQRARNARRPISSAEEYALTELRDIGDSEGFIESGDLPKFGTSVAKFDEKLESHVVDRGWMAEKPSKVVARWAGRGVLAIVAGVIAVVVGINLPASGLVLIGAAIVLGGIVILIVSKSMPSVTMAGAMIRAMLAAYRRTLQKTMEQARSMQQVVDTAGLAWLETPDQAVVWGTALGLQGEIESVLQRSFEDVREQPSLASSTYFPVWYQTSSGTSVGSGIAAGSGGSIFSGSPVPDIGGMMSSLGTIGNSPSSSGGSGGGFSGGSSGGGGGGAGGGF